MKTMKDETEYACPRCGYRLAPVFARKDESRRPIGYCCPEPYCSYVQSRRPENPGPSLVREYAVNRAG